MTNNKQAISDRSSRFSKSVIESWRRRPADTVEVRWLPSLCVFRL